MTDPISYRLGFERGFREEQRGRDSRPLNEIYSDDYIQGYDDGLLGRPAKQPKITGRTKNPNACTHPDCKKRALVIWREEPHDTELWHWLECNDCCEYFCREHCFTDDETGLGQCWTCYEASLHKEENEARI